MNNADMKGLFSKYVCDVMPNNARIASICEGQVTIIISLNDHLPRLWTFTDINMTEINNPSHNHLLDTLEKFKKLV